MKSATRTWFKRLPEGPRRAIGWLRSGFGKLVLAIAALLLLSTVGFYFLELRPRGETLFSSFYWAVVTLTTVGYGDLVPASTPGRIMGLLVMMSGIGLVSTLTGNLASLLVERKAQKRKGLLKVKLSGHIVILGWNSYAFNLIQTLLTTKALHGVDVVLVNELSQEKRDELAFKLQIAFDLELGERLHFVYGNPTQESVVSRASPASARVVYILSQDGMEPKEADQQSIYAALTTRALDPKVLMYGEVALTENREHLLRAGVSEIIIRGELTSLLLGLMGANPSVWPFFQMLMGLGGTGNLDYRVLNAEERKMTWREFLEHSRRRDGSLPLALCHESRDLSLQDMLDEGSALDQFILELFAASGQEAQLGQQGPRVLLNPPDVQPLEGYDSILFLKAGTEAA